MLLKDWSDPDPAEVLYPATDARQTTMAIGSRLSREGATRWVCRLLHVQGLLPCQRLHRRAAVLHILQSLTYSRAR